MKSKSQPTPVLTPVKLTKLSVCACGFPTLSDEIQLGEKYLVDLKDTPAMHMICGGCGTILNLTGVYVESRTGRPGYLPLDIFAKEPV